MEFFVKYRPIIDFSQALLAPVIGVVVAYIAYRQHKISSHRIKLDLYNKRYEIYRHIKSFYSLALQNGTVTWKETLEFYSNVRESEFLFDISIWEYIDEIYKKGVKIDAINKLLEAEGVGEKRTKLVKEQSDLMVWFVEEVKNVSARFKQYLDISQIS